MDNDGEEIMEKDFIRDQRKEGRGWGRGGESERGRERRRWEEGERKKKEEGELKRGRGEKKGG